MEKNYFLPAEWHPQSYIQLTWPHSETDWNYMLDDVEACFLNLAREIASRQPLLLVAPEYPEILKGLDCKDNTLYFMPDKRYMGARPWIHHLVAA